MTERRSSGDIAAIESDLGLLRDCADALVELAVERALLIGRLRTQGISFRRIGRAAGLAPESVRQIAAKVEQPHNSV